MCPLRNGAKRRDGALGEWSAPRCRRRAVRLVDDLAEVPSAERAALLGNRDRDEITVTAEVVDLLEQVEQIAHRERGRPRNSQLDVDGLCAAIDGGEHLVA